MSKKSAARSNPEDVFEKKKMRNFLREKKKEKKKVNWWPCYDFTCVSFVQCEQS